MTPLEKIFFLSWAQTCLHAFALVLLAATAYLYALYAPKKNLPVTPLSLLIPLAAACGGLWRPFFVAGILAVAALFFNRWRLFILHALACCLQTGLLLHTQSYHHRTLETFFATQQHTLHAVVSEVEPWPRHKNGFLVTLQVTHADYQPLTGTIRCFLYRTPRFCVGDTLCIYRCQTNIATNRPPHLLWYAVRENVTGTMFAPFLRHRILSSNLPAHWLHTWRARQRTTLYTQLKEKLSPKTFIFVGSLFFGNKRHENYAAVRRSFASWGLSHYLARSGLHIALIIMFLSAFFCLVPCSSWLTFCCIACFLCWYWLASWSSISFIRALILWLLHAAGIAAHRTPQPIYLLCLIALGTLLFAPSNGLCLDFQLSFFLTGVLLIRTTLHKHQFFWLLAPRETN